MSCCPTEPLLGKTSISCVAEGHKECGLGAKELIIINAMITVTENMTKILSKDDVFDKPFLALVDFLRA